MKLLFDFFPIITFFAAFKLADIYVATAASIAASFVQVGWHWVRTHRFETMHLVTLAVIVVFGGMTLLLHDDTFIKWKPTLVNWIFSVVLLGSQWVGRKPVIERMLNTQIDLPGPVWRRLNFSWGVFFFLMGALNVYVAFFYGLDLDDATRQSVWVNFKVFGLLGLTLIFAVVQALFLARHMAPMEKEKP